MADCSCIKGEGNFNFIISALSDSVLLYQDLSDWMEHPNYATPTQYTLLIKLPNTETIKEVVIDIQKVNRITSEILFGKDGVIPDGIYCFSVENCGYKYSRHAAIVRKLECCTDKLFMEGVDTKELDDLIRKIKISTQFQDMTTATKLYKIASEKIKLNNCFC